MFEELKDIASKEFSVKIKKVKRETPLTFEELFGVGTKNMDQDKIILTKEEYDDLCANYDKVYEQAKADILDNISDGGTSCHWCIDENRRIGKEEALKQIWHKVADGDLPESNQEIRWIDKTGEHYNGIFHTNIKTLSGDVQMFSSDIGCNFYKDEVIAWTELPTYEEK